MNHHEPFKNTIYFQYHHYQILEHSLDPKRETLCLITAYALAIFLLPLGVCLIQINTQYHMQPFTLTYSMYVCQSSFLQLRKVHCVDMPPAVYHPFLYLKDISAVSIWSAFNHLNTYKFYHSIIMFKKCFQKPGGGGARL